jgi:hypothetical protein
VVEKSSSNPVELVENRPKMARKWYEKSGASDDPTPRDGKTLPFSPTILLP